MEYKVKDVKSHGYIVTENGHTMMAFDVQQRLKRLDFLEQERKERIKDKQLFSLAHALLYYAGSKFGDNGCNDLKKEIIKLMDDKKRLLEQYNELQEDDNEKLESIEDCSDFVLMWFVADKLKELTGR